jgi:hypothetical protein
MSPSIIGAWTQTEVQIVKTEGGVLTEDTAFKYDRQYSVTFTADSQYYYSGPRIHQALGIYSTRGDMLHELSPATNMATWLKIISLTDHKLVLQIQEISFEAGGVCETTTTYTR